MPMHHHHHENQRDKRNEALMRKAAQSSNVAVLDRPVLCIDIGEARINEIIRSETNGNEDAFQDTWVSILDGKATSEDEIRNLARGFSHSNFVHKFAEVSLDEPLGNDNDGGHPITILDIMASPEIVIDMQEPRHTRPAVISGKARVRIDQDVLKLLRDKFPGQPYQHALRQALGLPTQGTKFWKQAEKEILKQNYSEMRIESLSEQLGRSVNSIRGEAYKLGLKKLKRARKTPTGAYSKQDIIKIFSFGKSSLQHVTEKGLLHWSNYKGQQMFSRESIVEFIRSFPFEYRHELLPSNWRSYIPPDVWSWLTIEQAAAKVHYSHYKIRRLIKSEDIPVKYYCPHTKAAAYVQLSNITSVLEVEGEPQPYQVARYIDKRHYVYWNDDRDLVMACAPNGHTVATSTAIEFGHKPSFMKGHPTCLKCLAILKKERENHK